MPVRFKHAAVRVNVALNSSKAAADSMSGGKNAQAPQQGDEEGYNDEEQRFLDGEESDEDDTDVVIGARASRKRGCPSDRLMAVFNQNSPEHVLAHFGIQVADDLTDEER